MSKNLTRKSAAFGAVVALATTLFAGAPAFAGVDDGSVTIAPTTGTSYNALLTTDFSLDVNYSSGIAINGGALTARIEDSTSQAKAAFSQTSTSPAVQTYTAGVVNLASATASNSTNAATADVLRISLPSTVTATTAVGVTVWYDSNADEVIGASEKVAAKVTVTFYKASDITWTASLVSPTVNDATLTGEITSSVVLNGQQIGNDTVVKGDFGSSITNSTINQSSTSTFNSTSKSWKIVSGAITNAVAGVTYSVRPYVIDAVIGTRVYTSVGTVTVATSTALSVTPSADVNTSGKVRPGTREVTLSITGLKANGDAVAAGVPVKFNWTGTVTGYDATTAPITLNGVALASGANLTVATDATGTAKVTVKVPATVVAGNNITITVPNIENVSGTTKTQVLTWETPDFTAVDASGIDGELASSNYGNIYETVNGASTTLNIQVLDQWKQKTTATDLVIKAVSTGRTVSTTYTPVSSGVASVVIADGSIGTGTTTVSVLTLEKNASGSYTTLTSGTTPKSTAGTNMLDAQGVQINYVASGTGKVTLGGTKAGIAEDLAGTVKSDAIAAANTDLQNVDAPVASADSQVVGVVANAATGALLGGTSVTVSGSGLLFNVGSAYGLGTLTFRANEVGEFAVNVFANKVTTGTVVTVTSNGGSATKTVAFTSALTPKSLTITAPAYAQAGTAVDVVATVADKWGNGVSADSLTISSSGPGYLNATGSTTTLTGGVVRAKLILGAAETGNVVITATTTNTNGTFATAANRTVTAAMTVGLAAAAPSTTATTAAIAGSTKRFFVSVDRNSSARNVVVKVAGKTFRTLKGAEAKKTYLVAAPKGSHKVTVFVGGKLIATKTIVVK